ESEMDEKERVYGERYPIDEDFLAALVDMPPASGVALGFDRLVVLSTGARTIDDVLWIPTQPDSVNSPMPAVDIACLCRLPVDFYAGRPLCDLIRSSGLTTSPESLTREAVLEELRREPALIDEWQQWSEDIHRDGWLFAKSGGRYRVYRQSLE